MDLIEEYRRAFGEYPPATVEWAPSPEELRHAILTGVRISIEDAPKVGLDYLA